MKRGLWLISRLTCFALSTLFMQLQTARAEFAFLSPHFRTDPYDMQVAEQIAKLRSSSVDVRAGAAESLGFLRAYSAADSLVHALSDKSEKVRRQAAISLGWCGGRSHVERLLTAIEDEDWVVRQATWVSLTNLTAMQWPFDSLAEPSIRGGQAKQWRDWWEAVPDGTTPSDVLELIAGEDLEGRLHAVRALGALGGRGATWTLLKTVAPYRDAGYGRLDAIEKNIVQCAVRSLGRLGDPQALSLLIGLLDTEGWARYAADALGDFGDARAVRPLIAAYPRFSRNLSNRRKNPEICPPDDRFSGDNTQDRMHETPYAIAAALVRLPLDDSAHVEALRKISPYLIANLPTSWDSGVFYEIEAAQLTTAYLLEKAALRRRVCDIAFEAATRIGDREPDITGDERSYEEIISRLALRMYGDVPDIATWFPAFCRGPRDVERLIDLLEHENGWISINAAKALMFIGDKRAIEPLAKLLKESKPEALWGYSGALEHAEYNDPAPRRREAFVRALGRLGAKQYDHLPADILHDHRNVVDLQYAAALALDEMGTPKAVAALERAEAAHPFESVRLVAREALWRRGLLRSDLDISKPAAATEKPAETVPDRVDGKPEAIVFIKGNRQMRSDFNGQAGVDPWRQAYTITNSGPAMRVGRNLYKLRPAAFGGKVSPLTAFEDGFVADCEISWDGKKIIFARRLNGEERNYKQVRYRKAQLRDPGELLLGGPDDPWWHIWEMNADGTGLRQLTFGPYHDVSPAYLPDGRIVFSSSRLGLRDEYHGFPCIGLAVMNPDGSDINVIGFNLGGDRDPAVLEDGRIVFSRIDIFYSRLKTEVAIHTVFPDGTRNESLYGPERRAFWREVHRKYAAWTMRPSYGGSTDNRNRVLRLSQPQPFGDGRIICTSSGGVAIVGPGRNRETLVPYDRTMAVTSPFPIDDRNVLCAATIKQFEVDGRVVTCGSEEFQKLEKGPELFRSAINNDLGIYLMDTETGKMELIYNDPETADFEPRPIMPRRTPVVLTDSPRVKNRSYAAGLFCHSGRVSRNSRVEREGRLLRVIEGRPIVSRHETQQNRPTNRWKNHGGTHARVLGTMPLAADGSFFVKVPADRLLHLQILDSDRRVMGNQLFWMYARPGETRSCVGCHEQRDRTHLPDHFAKTAKIAPVEMLPSGDEFSYRAKAWLKGVLPDEAEERTRTVRAVNLIGRY
ncbi:MAG: HEAT repeat domain-containing protein [Planctomycetota bacterium]|jgi:HEAT repeat protein